MLISTAFAQSAGGSTDGSLFGVILQLLMIFAIFYLLLIRPQQKRLKEHEAKLNTIKRGDNIITGGGIYAKVVEIFNATDELKVEIASGVVITIAKSTVREVLDANVAPMQPEKVKKEVKKKAPANTNKKS